MHATDTDAAEAAPALPAFTIDAKALSKAVAIVATLAPRCDPYRGRGPDILHCVLIEVDGEGLRLSATDCETFASIALPCDQVTRPGRCAVPARQLASMVSGFNKGTLATFEAEGARGLIYGGRARFNLDVLDADQFPVLSLDAIEPAETWEAPGDDPAALADGREEGCQLPDLAAKLIGRAVTRAKPTKKSGLTAPAAQLARFAGEESVYTDDVYKAAKPARLRVTLGDVTISSVLAAPAFDYRTKHNPWNYGYDGDRASQAAEYCRFLCEKHGLPTEVDGHAGRLQYRDGVALGMTFGEGYWDESGFRPMPDGWEPPAGTEIECADTASPECEVDGVRYSRLGDEPWHYWHVGSRALLYPDGAYSVIFPIAERPVISDILLTVDGRDIAVATNGSGKINLTAAQIAELAGPIDEMTRVEIAPIAMFQGERVPAGLELPTPPKMSDRAAARMTAAEMRAYCEACRPCLPIGERVRLENEAAEAVAMIAADAMALPEPSNVIAVDFAAAAAARDAAEALAAEPDLPAPVQSASPPTAGPDNAALLAMVERLASRVAALESGRAPPAEPNSVRQLPRALRLRIVGRYLAMRARRALDVAALDASREYLATVEAGHADALAEAETAAGALRAELTRQTEMRMGQVRGYSARVAELEAECARRNAVMVEAERRAEEAEASEERMRVELEELRDLEAEKDALFDQLATLERKRKRSRPADDERVSAPIILTTEPRCASAPAGS